MKLPFYAGASFCLKSGLLYSSIGMEYGEILGGALVKKCIILFKELPINRQVDIICIP